MTTSHAPVVQSALHDAEAKMKKTIERQTHEFSGLRTGRASTALVDNLKVEYYKSTVPLKQVAAVSIPDGRTLEIKPWDVGSLASIEKAIHASDLALTPNNDGKLIRLNIPTMTEERRRDLVKVVKKLGEEFRVSIRNDRREAMEKIKTGEKNKLLTEDQRKNAETSLQHLTDSYIKQVDDAIAAKEKEILAI